MQPLFSLLPLTALSAVCLVGCSVHSNNPPSAQSPEPAPHRGVFVTEGHDTLTFCGDGQSISWHLNTASAGHPSSGQGTYAFLFHHALYRYDLAERFVIYQGSETIEQFSLSPAHPCSDTLLILTRFTSGDSQDLIFHKVAGL
ncbi:MAG: hypothetical protein Q4B58_08250 [Bacteroidales bacterium]|nr:hypothetical protein [Bacteroidales bacterium]